MTDQEYMRRALQLAMNGSGFVNPNPLVGAVVVKSDRIIGEGWHVAYGMPHAERHALANCTEDPAGATVYVTLEPCCHTGKTPPCTEALIEAGVARVCMGAPDPNPKVAGKGVAALRAAGIEVTEGVLVEECLRINDAFFHYITTGLPLVVLKYAMTLDGKIATKTGASKWITSSVARERVHADRAKYAAIMVGVGTVLKDDPLLTCRIQGREAKNPLRVVCDTHLRTPLDCQIVGTAHEVPTVIATVNANVEDHVPFLEAGCQILVLPVVQGKVSLPALISELGKMGIDSVIVEGGAELIWSVVAAGLVDKVQAYVAPKLFGGSAAPTPVMGEGVSLPSEAFALGTPRVEALGEDLLIECEVK